MRAQSSTRTHHDDDEVVDFVSVTTSQPAVVVLLDGVRAMTIPGGLRRDSVQIASNVAFRELSFEVASFGDTRETFAFNDFSAFEVPLLNFVGSCSSLVPPPTPAPTPAPTPVPTPVPAQSPNAYSRFSAHYITGSTSDNINGAAILSVDAGDIFLERHFDIVVFGRRRSNVNEHSRVVNSRRQGVPEWPRLWRDHRHRSWRVSLRRASLCCRCGRNCSVASRKSRFETKCRCASRSRPVVSRVRLVSERRRELREANRQLLLSASF
jgi:hypothetical protein